MREAGKPAFHGGQHGTFCKSAARSAWPFSLGLAAYLWASPYRFLRALQGAILEGDRARLERMVDFPRVREGLKSQIQAQLLKEAGQAGEQNPFAGLAYLLVAGMVDPLVDALISPEGLAALAPGLSQDKPPRRR